MERLAQMEAELEAKLREGAKPRVATTVAAEAEAPVKVLNAGPLEIAAAPVAEPAGPRKGFGADQGDYYPTEVHGKKKD
jgi:hypothetical protein